MQISISVCIYAVFYFSVIIACFLPVIFLLRFICLKGRPTEREWAEIFHLLACFSNSLNRWCWVRLKPGAGDFMWFFPEGRGPMLGHPLLPPQPLSRERETPRVRVRCHSFRWRLSFPHHNAGPSEAKPPWGCCVSFLCTQPCCWCAALLACCCLALDVPMGDTVVMPPVITAL